MKTLIAGNWKMHKNVPEAIELAKAVKKIKSKAEMLICPPFTALYPVAGVLKGSKVSLGAQNMHQEEKGAFTGEIAPGMLKDIGCEYVILGHSERRHIFHEENDTINAKVKAALHAGLKPILCAGETLEERDAGHTKQVLEYQLRNGLKGVSADDMKKLTVAYEPVWAIGTGKTATAEQADDAMSYIKHVLEGLYQDITVRLLYGGSVKPDNAAELLAVPVINGFLIGGASLDAEQFAKIAAAADK